jgi:hypothetical protein
MDPYRMIDATASAQYGVVTTAQCRAVLGRARLNRWAADGRLIRVQPQVWRLAGAPETWHQRLMSAQLAAIAVISHRSAAEVWGLIEPAGHVEVSVPANRQPRLHAPAVVHRIADLHPDRAIERCGLRLTDPVRTLVDLGLVMPRRAVGRALGRALSTRLVAVSEVQWLREALGRPGRNGVGIIGRHIDDRLLTAPTEESVLEARLVDVLRRHSVPLPTFQHEIWHGGRFVARVDGAYPDRRVAIEVDGYLHHSAPTAFQRDRTRQNALVRRAHHRPSPHR